MVNDQQRPVVLVTGGAGYVGCHSVLLLLESKYKVVVVDNCSNTYPTEVDSNGNLENLPESLRRVEMLAKHKLEAFYKVDLVNDGVILEEIFMRHKIRAVIHFAALKSVSESISQPLEYYTNNLVGTINLLNTMKQHGCRDMIFSSSATVYGLPQYLPVNEKHQVGLNVLNPYGRTKCMIEQILVDLCQTPDQKVQTRQLIETNSNHSHSWNIISLRYFNPVGAHPSGFIGEHSQDLPSNIMPYISQVAIGKRKKLYIFGDDFDTIDGTGVRDYIHIMDLANGHIHALSYLFTNMSGSKGSNYKVFNLGTGRGYSVLELVKAFEQANGVEIPYEVTARRAGDAGEVYADPSLALMELGWSSKYNLLDMVRDTYNWQRKFPDGFKSACAEFEPNGQILTA